jgi:hypothetical protein
MFISELDPADPRARASKPPTTWDAIHKADIAQGATLKTLQATADDLIRRMDALEAAQPRKPAYTIARGQS